MFMCPAWRLGGRGVRDSWGIKSEEKGYLPKQPLQGGSCEEDVHTGWVPGECGVGALIQRRKALAHDLVVPEYPGKEWFVGVKEKQGYCAQGVLWHKTPIRKERGPQGAFMYTHSSRTDCCKRFLACCQGQPFEQRQRPLRLMSKRSRCSVTTMASVPFAHALVVASSCLLTTKATAPFELRLKRQDQNLGCPVLSQVKKAASLAAEATFAP
eukprot:1159955-Pelagomonas_calceolata.AAC.11